MKIHTHLPLRSKGVDVCMLGGDDGNFAKGEYLHALRLASELADLRAANTHPIRAWSLGANKVRLLALTKFYAIVGSASGFFVVDSTNRKGTHFGVPFVIGGDDGNRTRVQKPLDITFSVGSQSIRIPASERRVTGFRQGSPLMHDRYKGNSRFMFTTDLTHGGSRSPHPRYGRLKSRVTAYAARATELLSFII